MSYFKKWVLPHIRWNKKNKKKIYFSKLYFCTEKNILLRIIMYFLSEEK